MLSFFLTLCIIGFFALLLISIIPESDYEHPSDPPSHHIYLAARERNRQEFLARRQRDADGASRDR